MFTVVGPTHKPNQTSIAVPENPIQAYLSIRQLTMTVNPSRHIMPPLPPPIQLPSNPYGQ